MKQISIMIALIFTLKSGAQMVQNKSYSVTLKTLLSHSVPEVGVKDITSTKGIVFIDAREKKEFDVSHINNAVWCGYDDFDISRVNNIDKKKKVVVYCSVGYRSEKVAEKLIDEGFKDVSNLYGGIFEWRNQEQPVVDSSKSNTEKVHAYNKVWGIWLNNSEKVYD